jgi:hypothetical protein
VAYRIDLRCDLVASEVVTRIVDDTLARVNDRLCLAGVDFELVVAAGTSSVVGRRIHVAPRPARGALTEGDWFELLFAHEYTHLVLEARWKPGPALWWEGLPIHLGDDHVRTRATGLDYHAHCRALDDADRLLPLVPLIGARGFYARRRDHRVDLQAGSFCGFLLDAFGVAPLRALLTAYQPPSAESPRVSIDPLLRHHLGAPFDELERRWRAFLRTRVAAPQRAACAEVPPGPGRCDGCYRPLDGACCPSCGPVPLEVVP